LQTEYDSFRQKVLTRRNERIHQAAAALEASYAQRQAAVAARAPRIAAVEETLEGMEARFTDAAIALEYDAQRLLEKFGAPSSSSNRDPDNNNPKSRPKQLPCLGERAHWMDCSKKYVQDTRPCDAYVRALERCGNEAIIQKTTTTNGV
jgi:hypothetical protein